MKADRHVQDVVYGLVKRLVSEYAPQKIILFGPYAFGRPNQDSDIDLFIIKETSEKLPQRMDRVRRLVTGIHRGIPFDPIILTPQEVDQRLKAGDQFIAEIIQRGEVLHAA